MFAPASSAPSCAAESMPNAIPLTTVTPAADSPSWAPISPAVIDPDSISSRTTSRSPGITRASTLATSRTRGSCSIAARANAISLRCVRVLFGSPINSCSREP